MEIVQQGLPLAPWMEEDLSRLPGMRVVEGSWIVTDEAWSAQLAEKARLLAERRAEVLACLPGSEAAQAEALEVILASLPEGFRREGEAMRCPDGRRVVLKGPPLEIASRLVQEDLLILMKDGPEHVLKAALLCFPASWTLAEKIGRPLLRIHAPVPDYMGDTAMRVQRMFDRVPAGRAMFRANALGYARADLFHPRSELAPRDKAEPPRFLRSERQTVLRLPRTGAMLFAVHTWVVPLARLTPEQRATCPYL